MILSRFVGVLLTFLLISGCRGNPPLDHLKEVRLDSLGMIIRIPEDAGVQHLSHGASVELNPGGRTPRNFLIVLGDQAPVRPEIERLNLSRELPNGAQLRFHTWIVQPEGSGGQEFHMEGLLSMESQNLYVKSLWQEEVFLFDGSKNRRQDFALLYLGTMEEIDQKTD